MTTRNEDEVINLLFARTLDHILFFTNKGRVYSSRVYECPKAPHRRAGAHIANVLSLQADENGHRHARRARLRAGQLHHAAHPPWPHQAGGRQVRQHPFHGRHRHESGRGRFARLRQAHPRRPGIPRGDDARQGAAFDEKTVRAWAGPRPASWPSACWTATRSSAWWSWTPGPISRRPHRRLGQTGGAGRVQAKGRYTQGVLTTDVSRLSEIGDIVSARVVRPNDQITVITSNGIVLRTNVEGISQMGRSTRGVRIVNLMEGDRWRRWRCSRTRTSPAGSTPAAALTATTRRAGRRASLRRAGARERTTMVGERPRRGGDEAAPHGGRSAGRSRIS